MKITTANTKSPLYKANHELFIGTHTGSFKKIDVNSDEPHRQVNLQTISALNKFSRVTALNWGEGNEILVGRANKFVKIYDASTSEATGNIELIDAPIVGIARYGSSLIAGIGTGRVQIIADTATILDTGDNMSTMCQCKTDSKLVATGGKQRQNNLKVWDLETQKKVFTSKNVPNDYLQLEVPVWDSGLAFADESTLLSCSRLGYIRRYDTRAQRRPVVEWTNSKEQISYNCLASHEHLLYTGTSTGIIRAFDQRRLKVVAHTYKGFTGSISDIGLDESGRFLFSASLDRYARVHCSQSTALLYQCYVKSKATKILLRTKEPEAAPLNDSDCVLLGEEADEEEENESVEKEETAGSDPEFEAIFENMQTIREGEIESEDDDVKKKRPQSAKRKSVGASKVTNKKKK